MRGYVGTELVSVLAVSNPFAAPVVSNTNWPGWRYKC